MFNIAQRKAHREQARGLRSGGATGWHLYRTVIISMSSLQIQEFYNFSVLRSEDLPLSGETHPPISLYILHAEHYLFQERAGTPIP